jgi:hypothetical protein
MLTRSWPEAAGKMREASTELIIGRELSSFFADTLPTLVFFFCFSRSFKQGQPIRRCKLVHRRM